MTIKIGSNIASMNAQRRLGEADTALSRTFERLSSGQRINKASDDAAGLAIADSLKAKGKIYAQAIKNGNDGISLLNIADSAINELSSIVVRIRELSEQSANGTYSNKQREALDLEAQQLSKEFTRITQTTSFNGMKLFDGTLGRGTLLQLGNGIDEALRASVGGAIGTGEFASAATYSSIGVTNTAVVLGDLNSDGVLDLVSTGTNGLIEVRMGQGGGNFGSALVYTSAGLNNMAAGLGDLNGDGILDMVTAGYGRSLEVRLGRGDGSFQSAMVYTTVSSANRTFDIGDLNGDGKLDLVSAGIDNMIEVRLGQGDGSFGAAVIYSSNNVINYAAVLGDLNGDGVLDLATASADRKIEIRLGLGDGRFGAASVYTSDSTANLSASLGDLNGDGILDLVAGGGSNRVEVRLGKGDGSFGVVEVYTSQSATNRATLGDLDGDGILDLVIGGNLSKVTVRLGLGDGRFGADMIYTSASTTNVAVGLGDLNDDGVLDFITAGNGNRIEAFKADTQEGLGAMQQFSLKTRQGSLQAMSMLDQTLQRLARQRGSIGASQSRVSIAIQNLQAAKENFAAAESRIRDVDIAEESSALVRTQILQKAATSVLAQANQQPALALQLLG